MVKKAIKWRKSDEKKKLKEDIEKGRVTDLMPAKQVYNMHEGMYHKYDFDKFAVNFRNLKIYIAKGKKLAAEAVVILGNTLEGKLDDYNSSSKTWQWSDARKSAQEAITTKSATGKKPKEIYQSKLEYQEYTLKQFRDNFNKEKYKMDAGTSGYWLSIKERQARR